MYRKLLLVIPALIIPLLLTAAAQALSHKDSLYQRLDKLPPNIERVNTYLALGEALVPDSVQKAEKMMKDALALSIQLGYQKGVADFTMYYMYIQDLKGEYMQSLYLLQQAEKIYSHLKDTTSLMNVHNFMGNEFQQVGNFKAAADQYMATLELADIRGDSMQANKITINLSSVFILLGDYHKGLEYAKKAYQFAEQRKHKWRMASALNCMGAALLQLKQHDQANKIFTQVIQLGREVGDSIFVLNGTINMASVLSCKGDHKSSLELFREAEAITKAYPAPDKLINILLGIGNELFLSGKYVAAEEYINKSISLSKIYLAGNELHQAYLVASDLKAATGKPAEALALRKQYEKLHDSLLGNTTRSSVQQLESRYATARNDKNLTEKKLQVATINLELHRKNKWILYGMVGFILLMIPAIIYWLKLRHRHRLQLQQLQTMEAERTVQVLEAMMQGEERERTRLSKDLHDGVGGLLSAVKLHFSALRHERPYLKEDPGFLHAMGILDDAVVEVRKTAHNLMPEILSRVGLSEALGFYCRNVSHSRKLLITYESTGQVRRYNASFELSVYRIVQELINNIIKHSRASAALVQLVQEEHTLSIQVEDNGIGFQHQPELHQGMGLRNLHTRIKALNGNLDIDASAGRGTTAYIAFNIIPMQLAK
ncbi:tetratricopeptide repeat-containing sensor histidine kinase [Chitinophaga sp. sic0106]|uniref:ATP-binding protein n=1 Tax=Chitinophaga sp. sic0106 TaxID=2854785 RepID=UPI001C447796|nr:tetratricopeptide repeat-containing sensor histidine kinase [Chitinophaga sp. sic0106]MBV7532420.1 tetratricopeptide repeat protein [Chitinophaga sp. sic0106]